MKEGKRYDITGLVEAQFEPDSYDQVLKNKLGIKSKKEMDRLETEKLEEAVDQLVRTYEKSHRFTEHDVCKFHKVWLGDIYDWAGSYRKVNVSKDNFPFAAVAQIPTLMDNYEKDVLSRYTPCNAETKDGTIKALAEVHTELVLIHPFREGNGRVARILSIMMALQAGLPLLDFSPITGKKREEYFAAVRAGLKRNYEPMEKIFNKIIEKTLLAS